MPKSKSPLAARSRPSALATKTVLSSKPSSPQAGPVAALKALKAVAKELGRYKDVPADTVHQPLKKAIRELDRHLSPKK